jgi:hypothetical protein
LQGNTINNIILTVKEKSSVSIYTDSKNLIHNYNLFRNNEKNYRVQVKNKNHLISWSTILYIIKILELSIEIHKVKAHTGNKWNDLADVEANKGRMSEFSFSKKQSCTASERKYKLQFFNIEIDDNHRNFIKNIHRIKNEEELYSLNRNTNIDQKEIDKTVIYEYIKNNFKKTGDIKKFTTFKDQSRKVFKIKKLMEELPVLENLKKRKPDVYKANLKCIRCNTNNEDVKHLWECKKANNDIQIIGNKSRHFLNKKLGCNRNKDKIMNALYKYTVTSKHLELYNNESNTKYYREKGENRFNLTYVWDNKHSMNDLIRGWIPKEIKLICIDNGLKSKTYKDLIINWLTKLNKWFHELIWKKRNEKYWNGKKLRK